MKKQLTTPFFRITVCFINHKQLTTPCARRKELEYSEAKPPDVRVHACMHVPTCVTRARTKSETSSPAAAFLVRERIEFIYVKRQQFYYHVKSVRVSTLFGITVKSNLNYR